MAEPADGLSFGQGCSGVFVGVESKAEAVDDSGRRFACAKPSGWHSL